MDHQQSSFVWDESDVDIVPSFFASMGGRVWRVEAGENCRLFFRFYQVHFFFFFSLNLSRSLTGLYFSTSCF